MGELDPVPSVEDGEAVILFGSYALWRHAERHGLRPGVIRIRPFLDEAPWQDAMLNGPGALRLRVSEVAQHLTEDRDWFVRPVADAKEVAGRVRSTTEVVEMARKVLALPPEEIPGGSLRPETELMLTRPTRIEREWRVWIVGDRVVTWSLYREGRRVVYRAEIDDDARAFAQALVGANPGYAPAYVMDVCRTADGLRLLETNCINAAGFYAADLGRLVAALDHAFREA